MLDAQKAIDDLKKRQMDELFPPDPAPEVKKKAIRTGDNEKTLAAKAYYESLVAANKFALEKIDAEEKKALFENQKRLVEDKDNAGTGGADAQEKLIRAEAAAAIAAEESARLLNLDASQIYADKKAAIEEEMYRRIKAARDAANASAEASTNSIFGSLLSITKNAAGEQSGIYQAMFAAQKAYSIAQSIVAIQTGIANAASTPWPLNLAAMASVSAATASIVSTISGTNVSGGRQYGGPANAGNLYRVNETGAPEMFTAGNGQQYMMPTQSGQVTAADKVGGSSGMTVIINNAPPGTTAAMDSQARLIIDIAVKQSVAEVTNQFSTNTGRAWNALRGASNVQGRM